MVGSGNFGSFDFSAFGPIGGGLGAIGGFIDALPEFFDSVNANFCDSNPVSIRLPSGQVKEINTCFPPIQLSTGGVDAAGNRIAGATLLGPISGHDAPEVIKDLNLISQSGNVAAGGVFLGGPTGGFGDFAGVNAIEAILSDFGFPVQNEGFLQGFVSPAAGLLGSALGGPISLAKELAKQIDADFGGGDLSEGLGSGQFDPLLLAIAANTPGGAQLLTPEQLRIGVVSLINFLRPAAHAPGNELAVSQELLETIHGLTNDPDLGEAFLDASDIPFFDIGQRLPGNVETFTGKGGKEQFQATQLPEGAIAFDPEGQPKAFGQFPLAGFPDPGVNVIAPGFTVDDPFFANTFLPILDLINNLRGVGAGPEGGPSSTFQDFFSDFDPRFTTGGFAGVQSLETGESLLDENAPNIFSLLDPTGQEIFNFEQDIDLPFAAGPDNRFFEDLTIALAGQLPPELLAELGIENAEQLGILAEIFTGARFGFESFSDAVDIVHGTQLVRTIRRDPLVAKYLPTTRAELTAGSGTDLFGPREVVETPAQFPTTKGDFKEALKIIQESGLLENIGTNEANIIDHPELFRPVGNGNPIVPFDLLNFALLTNEVAGVGNERVGGKVSPAQLLNILFETPTPPLGSFRGEPVESVFAPGVVREPEQFVNPFVANAPFIPTSIGDPPPGTDPDPTDDPTPPPSGTPPEDPPVDDPTVPDPGTPGSTPDNPIDLSPGLTPGNPIDILTGTGITGGLNVADPVIVQREDGFNIDIGTALSELARIIGLPQITPIDEQILKTIQEQFLDLRGVISPEDLSIVDQAIGDAQSALVGIGVPPDQTPAGQAGGDPDPDPPPGSGEDPEPQVTIPGGIFGEDRIIPLFQALGELAALVDSGDTEKAKTLIGAIAETPGAEDALTAEEIADLQATNDQLQGGGGGSGSGSFVDLFKDLLGAGAGAATAALFANLFSDDSGNTQGQTEVDPALFAQIAKFTPGPTAATAAIADILGLDRPPGTEDIELDEDFIEFLSGTRIDPRIPGAATDLALQIPRQLEEDVGRIEETFPVLQDIIQTGGMDQFIDLANRQFSREFLPTAAERFPGLGFGSGGQSIVAQGAEDISTQLGVTGAQRQLEALGLAPSSFGFPTALTAQSAGIFNSLIPGLEAAERLGSEGGSAFTNLGQLEAIAAGNIVPFNQEIPNFGGGTSGLFGDIASSFSGALGQRIGQAAGDFGGKAFSFLDDLLGGGNNTRP